MSANQFFAGCAGHVVDCDTAMPVIDLTGFNTPAIYVFVANYEAIAGVQCAFEWPANWTFTFGSWDNCQSNQINGVTPSASGAFAGTIATAFDFISGGAVAVLGAINFAAAPDGCVTIIESSFPFGTHVLSSTSDIVPVIVENRGIVCVGTGGYAACDSVVAVEPTTWGLIKRAHM